MGVDGYEALTEQMARFMDQSLEQMVVVRMHVEGETMVHHCCAYTTVEQMLRYVSTKKGLKPNILLMLDSNGAELNPRLTLAQLASESSTTPLDLHAVAERAVVHD